MKLVVITSIMAEAGVGMVLLNAPSNAPLGFRLWFGGIGLLVPLWVFWMYRHPAGRKAD